MVTSETVAMILQQASEILAKTDDKYNVYLAIKLVEIIDWLDSMELAGLNDDSLE